MKLKSSDKPHYLGHRERLRTRFLSNADSIADYELIELILFYVFSRNDTKAIAKKLLQHFGSLKNIVAAEVNDLKQIHGIGESVSVLFKAIHELFKRMSLETVSESVVISSSNHVLDYYKNIFWGMKNEQLRVMFLNNKNKLLADVVLQDGTVSQTMIYPREIMRRAMEYGASAIIMVHNHPSGDPKPSKQDIAITKAVRDIAERLDIVLLDHLIIGQNRSNSLKEMGII